MAEGFFLSHTHSWVDHQQFLDEIGEFGAKGLGYGVVKIFNLHGSLVSVSTLERRCACIELVGQNTNRPKIELAVVGFVGDYFWTDVIDGATKGLSVFSGMDSPAEVGQLDYSSTADEDVLGLQVAVDDV